MHQPRCTVQGARLFLQCVRHGVICVAACSSQFPLGICSATRLLAQFPLPCRAIHVLFLSLGGFLLCERTNICSSMFEVYEAATLPAETPTLEQEMQNGTPTVFCFEFWSKSGYPHSAKLSSNFVHFSVDFRCIWGGYPPSGTTF